MVMTSDETQIQIFANWPVSHAKRVTRDNRKNPEYRVIAAIRKLRTDCLLHRTEETQQGRNGCPRLQFGFQFGLYRVIVSLSFQRSISLASLFTSLSIFG